MKKGIIVLMFAVIPFVGGTTNMPHNLIPTSEKELLYVIPDTTEVVAKTVESKIEPVIKKDAKKISSKKEEKKKPINTKAKPSLYLSHKAIEHIDDLDAFEKKVKVVADKLKIPANWLMALVDSESGFNPHKKNKRGSGAKGLIQLMPVVYNELGLKKVPPSPLKQLDIAAKYLADKQKKYGQFNNFTELKLAVLYPAAVKKPAWYALFKKPSKRYKQNIGLDINKDGIISVADVRDKMKRDYPGVYR